MNENKTDILDDIPVIENTPQDVKTTSNKRSHSSKRKIIADEVSEDFIPDEQLEQLEPKKRGVKSISVKEKKISELPPPVPPIIVKKTRNRTKKVNTKTITRIQRFF